MTIQDIIQRIEQNKEALGITLYPPATLRGISNIERTFKLTFPTELRHLYSFCDGFESEEDLFRIVPLDEIQYMSKRLKSNQICIAEYLTYCDFWNMTINADGSYEISEGSFHTVLTNSLTDFLDHFLTGGVFEAGGLYEWKENIVSKRL
ncbi:MAG: hypothetical protein ACTHNW_14585 [Mucilaginibacter sp.]